MKAIWLLMLLAAVSCGKGSGGNNSSQVNSMNEITPAEENDQDAVAESRSLKISAVRKVELKDDHSNLEEYKNKINSYEIVFEAKSGSFKDADILCKKVIYNRLQTEFKDKFDKTGTIGSLDIELLSDDSSEVELDCSVREDGFPLESMTLILRKSYVISGRKNFMASVNAKRIHTLLLEKESELSINGDDIKFDAKEIISLGGRIVTFRDEAKPIMENRHGVSGGSISITTKTAQGNLAIEMRGLDAGLQTNIPEKIAEKIPANPDLNGKCRTYTGYTAPNKKDRNCFGKDGQPGLQGREGFSGFRGGNTGVLKLVVTNEHTLELVVSFHPGKGSLGGKGGIGGEGQVGGIGTTVTWDFMDRGMGGGGGGCCRFKMINSDYRYKYPDGAKGPQGLDGVQGKNGEDGLILPAKIEFLKTAEAFELTSNWSNL